MAARRARQIEVALSTLQFSEARSAVNLKRLRIRNPVSSALVRRLRQANALIRDEPDGFELELLCVLATNVTRVPPCAPAYPEAFRSVHEYGEVHLCPVAHVSWRLAVRLALTFTKPARPSISATSAVV